MTTLTQVFHKSTSPENTVVRSYERLCGKRIIPVIDNRDYLLLSITTVGTQLVVIKTTTLTRTLSPRGVSLLLLERTNKMFDLFYIVEVHDQWYNLCLKETHYCVGCGSDLNALVRTISAYVKKYKTAERVYHLIRGLSDGGRISPATLEQRQKEYEKGGWKVFNDLIHDTVVQAKQEDKKNSPFNRAKRSARPVVKDTPEKVAQEVVVSTPVKRITPHKIKRTLCAAI